MSDGKVLTLIRSGKLNNSLVIGYYGGGNYGDELLMELIMYHMKQADIAAVFYYQNLSVYNTFHQNYGHTIIDATHFWSLLRAFFTAKNIVIGGGGIWGMDVNLKIVVLSIMLCIAKLFFRKPVYLLGVGAYHSTSRAGKLAAKLAGLAATEIYARDAETVNVFRKWANKIHLVDDISFTLEQVDPNHFAKEIAGVEKAIPITGKSLILTLRRYKDNRGDIYNGVVRKLVMRYPGQRIILGICEPRETGKQNFEAMQEMKSENKNVEIFDFSFNPIAFFFHLKNNNKKLIQIAPQFHMLISAYLSQIPFLPLSYDNKSREFLKQHSYRVIPIAEYSFGTAIKFLGEYEVA